MCKYIYIHIDICINVQISIEIIYIYTCDEDKSHSIICKQMDFCACVWLPGITFAFNKFSIQFYDYTKLLC